MCLKKIQAGFNTVLPPLARLAFGCYCLCSVFIFTGCVTNQDMGRIQYDIIRLKSDVKNIKAGLPGKDWQSERLKGLEEEQKATGRAVSDLLIRIQSLTTEIQILTGRFEEIRHFSEKSSKELREDRDTLISRLKELETSLNDLKAKLARLESTAFPVKKQKPAEKTKRKKSEETKKEEKSPEKEIKNVYMEAYRTFKNNKFTGARGKFEALLKDYPENEYSDNARFWIGESYYKEKQYEEAILAYQELLDKNPRSDKVPGALLKQGLAFYKLKDKATGRIILEKLIEKFPDSEQSKVAKKKLSPPVPAKKKQ